MGPTAAVVELRRPVHLDDRYLVGDRTDDRLHLLPTFVDGRPNPEAGASTAAVRGQQAADARPRQARSGRRLYTPRRIETVELLEQRRCCRRSSSSSAATSATRPCQHVPRRRPAADHGDERDRIREIVDGAPRRDRRRRPRRARLRPVPRPARSRDRRPPRRHGPAVQGGRRGLLRRGAGQGRVRHRDAGRRRQHAGADGGDREADEVHRRPPRAARRRGSTRSSPAGPAGAASTTSATPSCCGARSSRSTRWPRWPAAARSTCARRSGRRTTWPPTSCGTYSQRRGPPPAQPVVRAVPVRPRRGAARGPARAGPVERGRRRGRRPRARTATSGSTGARSTDPQPPARAATTCVGGRHGPAAARRRRARVAKGRVPRAGRRRRQRPPQGRDAADRRDDRGRDLLLLRPTTSATSRAPSARSPARRVFSPNRAEYRREIARALAGHDAAADRAGRRGAGRSGGAHPVESDPDLRRADAGAPAQPSGSTRELVELPRRGSTGHGQSLAREFDRVLDVLDRRGLRRRRRGWSLTDARRACWPASSTSADLLVVECLLRGLLRRRRRADARRAAVGVRLRAPQPGAAAAAVVPVAATPRRAGGASSPRARTSPPTSGRPGSPSTDRPTPASSPPPTPGSRGEGLAEVVGDEELTGGDFVRTMKQLIDLARQVALVAPDAGDPAGTRRGGRRARVPRRRRRRHRGRRRSPSTDDRSAGARTGASRSPPPAEACVDVATDADARRRTSAGDRRPARARARRRPVHHARRPGRRRPTVRRLLDRRAARSRRTTGACAAVAHVVARRSLVARAAASR